MQRAAGMLSHQYRRFHLGFSKDEKAPLGSGVNSIRPPRFKSGPRGKLRNPGGLGKIPPLAPIFTYSQIRVHNCQNRVDKCYTVKAPEWWGR